MSAPRTWSEVRALALAENGAGWPCLYPLRPAPSSARPPWPPAVCATSRRERDLEQAAAAGLSEDETNAFLAALAVFDAATPAWEARLALEETVALTEERLTVLRKLEGWEDTHAGLVARADALVAELDAMRPGGRP